MQTQTTSTPTSDHELLAMAARRLGTRIEAEHENGVGGSALDTDRKRAERLGKAAAALQKPEETPAVPSQDMSKAPLRVAVSGGESRQQENRTETFAALEAIRHAAGDRPIQVLHATDAAWKTPTAMWADAYRYGRTQYSAAWKQGNEQNRLAGMERSKAVVKAGPDMVVALPDANRTGGQALVRLADEKGILTAGDGYSWPTTEDLAATAEQAGHEADRRDRHLDRNEIERRNREAAGQARQIGPVREQQQDNWPEAREIGAAPADANPEREQREVRVLVAGARRHRSEHVVEQALEEIRERAGGAGIVLVHGGEPGAETTALDWAERNGVEMDIYHAEWKKEIDGSPYPVNNPAAGAERNERMFEEGRPDMVLAFPEGDDRATRSVVRMAEKKGVPVEEVRFMSRHSRNGSKVDLAAMSRTPKDRAPGMGTPPADDAPAHDRAEAPAPRSPTPQPRPGARTAPSSRRPLGPRES